MVVHEEHARRAGLPQPPLMPRRPSLEPPQNTDEELLGRGDQEGSADESMMDMREHELLLKRCRFRRLDRLLHSSGGWRGRAPRGEEDGEDWLVEDEDEWEGTEEEEEGVGKEMGSPTTSRGEPLLPKAEVLELTPPAGMHKREIPSVGSWDSFSSESSS